MSGPSSNRILLVGLSASLVAALMAIAFLLGRESTRGPAAEARVPVPAVVEPEPIVQPIEPQRSPKWSDLDEWKDVEEPTFAGEPAGERIEQRPDGTLVLSNRRKTGDPSQVSGDSPAVAAGSRVAAYFLRMDSIQSQSVAGDPNTFAMGLIKAGLGGSTSGFDQLIADTQQMEEEIRAVTPPPSCEAYHQANLKSLAESREIIDAMKTAFERRDFSQLTAIAQRAGALQHEAQSLQEMRERILADAKR